MSKIVKPAVRVLQGRNTLFATSFLVKDFTISNFYDIDKLDVSGGKGYQRLLQEERMNRLARYMAESWREGHRAFLPTSIFLATEGKIDFNEERNEISFESGETGGVCPFKVVDGQHRIEGLLRASDTIPELENFPIIANIAVEMKEVEQVLQFFIVNTTQKAVDQSVGQRIKARFHKMLETETMPYIPSWIKPAIDKGSDAEALDIVDFLNSESDSPWYRRIQMANEGKTEGKSISQKYFVTALKTCVINGSHSLYLHDKEKRHRIFKNYWSAVAQCFTVPETQRNTVVFKSTGVWFFCRSSSAVINIANWRRSYHVKDFVDIFQSTREHLPDDLLPMMNAEWWESGNEASGLNRGMTDKKAIEFSQVVIRVAQVPQSESQQ
ncbi:MAG: DGQHR domain-containing protein [Nitrospira sp.]|nr:DGQHR domain-containing protein [Nitrospira sp.]